MKIEKLLVEASRRNLTKEEAVALLNIDNKSDLFYELIKTANRMTREEYDNKAYIFSQIGFRKPWRILTIFWKPSASW